MEREHRRHYRVAMRQLEETPAEGMYVTREEARGYAILTAALGALLFLMILFKGRKNEPHALLTLSKGHFSAQSKVFLAIFTAFGYNV